jgi:hypothetical protein
MKLLVNIAHHYEPSRQDNLRKVIRAIESYGVDATIYIDTNHPQLSSDLQDERVSVVWHKRMSHPFDLTAKHRIRIDESYQHFDAVAYFEDDMMLPAAGFEYWRTNFDAMHADGFYPSFVRVENYDGVEGDFTPDIVYPLNAEMEVKYDSRRFVALPYHINYHAFWIMTSKAIAALKEETSYALFASVDNGLFREEMASLPIWKCGLQAMVQLTDSGNVAEHCKVYHLTNNYQGASHNLTDVFRPFSL